MATAKDLRIKPITPSVANTLMRRLHYSGKVVPNSQLHFGVFYNGTLEGVMQFGPSINKKGTVKLVAGTRWNNFLELNRMAFSEVLPKNSESRAIGIALKIIKKNYPEIDWIISFADATQCGDGAIYRASNFVLTQIRENKALRVNPKTGDVMHSIQAHHLMIQKEWRNWETTKGYQLRYIYFLNPDVKKNLVAPIIPFSKITEVGAGMYRGEAKRGK